MKRLLDRFSELRSVKVLSLPIRQGIIIKP